MALFLVGMHGAAEDDDRVRVVAGNARTRELVLDELVAAGPDGVLEDAGTDARAVRDREHTHGPSRPSTSSAPG